MIRRSCWTRVRPQNATTVVGGAGYSLFLPLKTYPATFPQENFISLNICIIYIYIYCRYIIQNIHSDTAILGISPSPCFPKQSAIHKQCKRQMFVLPHQVRTLPVSEIYAGRTPSFPPKT